MAFQISEELPGEALHYIFSLWLNYEANIFILLKKNKAD